MRSDSPLGDVPPAAAPSTTAVDSAPSRPPPQTHQPTRRTVSQHHLSSNLTAADSPASSSAASPRLHPKDDPSQSQWKKPAEGSPQEVVPDTYLSAHLLDQIDPDSSHAGVAVSSPKYAEQEQAVRIDISEPSLDLMYRGSRDNLPITLFTSPHTFSIGRKMDVQNKVMVYATGKGRLRILDRTDGARVLLKGHNGPVSDLCLSDMPGVTEDDVLVISASVAAPTVILWRVARDVPPKASNDSHLPEGFVKVLEFSPKTPDATVRCIRRVSNDLFILATSDSRMLILDLSTDAWSRLVKGEDQVQQTEDQMKKSGLLRKVQFEYVSWTLIVVFPMPR